MSTFVLIPGSGGAAWTWHLVAALLRAAGHEVLAIDLPAEDPRAGLDAYARVVVDRIADRPDVVLVALSLGGFTAPLVCAATNVARLVFVNAMIPLPGETPGAWFGATGTEAARVAAAQAAGYPRAIDDATTFFHDVPPAEAAACKAHDRPQAQAVFADPCRFTAYPAIPTHVVIGADERLLPPAFQARVARERLGPGASIHLVPGGHLAPLAYPEELTAVLLALG